MTSHQHDLKQNLQKIGPKFSHVDEKRAKVIQLVKSGEIQAQEQWNINKNIPGLRRKRVAFQPEPSSFRWWQALGSFERNGVVNIGLSRNFVRFMYPIVPAFFYIYIMQPVIHGHTYVHHFQNF